MNPMTYSGTKKPRREATVVVQSVVPVALDAVLTDVATEQDRSQSNVIAQALTKTFAPRLAKKRRELAKS